MRIEPQQGAFFVGSHQAAVTGDVTSEDGRKPSFDPRTGHGKSPRSSVLRAKCMGPVGDLSIEATMSVGSKADVTLLNFDVRFTPKSGHCFSTVPMSALCQ
jgi:hypothetical protein